MKALRIISCVVFVLMALWVLACSGTAWYFINTDQRGHPPAAILAYPTILIGLAGLAVLLPLWIVLFALSTGDRLQRFKRRMRIKRGLCPKCAYDLRGSKDTKACPECGAAIRSLDQAVTL